MARQKSALRKRLNYRWVRWALSSALLSKAASLGDRLNFYVRGVVPEEVAGACLEDTRIKVTARFSATDLAFIRKRCRAYDSGASPGDAIGEAVFALRTYRVRDVELLGHTGAVAIPRHRAILSVDGGPPNWNYVKPRLLRRAAPLDDPAVVLSGTDNYFHFLMNDILPLVDYLERLHPQDAPLALVLPGAPPGFTTAVLEAIVAWRPRVRIVRIGAGEKLPLASLVSLERRAANREWYVWDPGLMRRLRDILGVTPRAASPGAAPAAPRNIFLLRGNARIRRLLNEPELVAIAGNHGFATFTPDPDDITEQIRQVESADAIVGVHGAGLANIAWCRPGARVLEIFPSNFTKSSYLWLAERMGASHARLVGGPGDYRQAFRVDPEAFDRALGELVSAPASTPVPARARGAA